MYLIGSYLEVIARVIAVVSAGTAFATVLVYTCWKPGRKWLKKPKGASRYDDLLRLSLYGIISASVLFVIASLLQGLWVLAVVCSVFTVLAVWYVRRPASRGKTVKRETRQQYFERVRTNQADDDDDWQPNG